MVAWIIVWVIVPLLIIGSFLHAILGEISHVSNVVVVVASFGLLRLLEH